MPNQKRASTSGKSDGKGLSRADAASVRAELRSLRASREMARLQKKLKPAFEDERKPPPQFKYKEVNDSLVREVWYDGELIWSWPSETPAGWEGSEWEQCKPAVRHFIDIVMRLASIQHFVRELLEAGCDSHNEVAVNESLALLDEATLAKNYYLVYALNESEKLINRDAYQPKLHRDKQHDDYGGESEMHEIHAMWATRFNKLNDGTRRLNAICKTIADEKKNDGKLRFVNKRTGKKFDSRTVKRALAYCID